MSLVYDSRKLKELLPLTVMAVLEAGKSLQKFQDDPHSLEVIRKKDRTLVTNADLASQDTLADYLPFRLTGATFVSEENDIPIPAEGAPHFLVDPIDGTHRFISDVKKGSGRDSFINVCLVEQGVPKLAVIYNIKSREIYLTAEGMKSYKFRPGTIWANADQTEIAFEKAVPLSIRPRKWLPLKSSFNLLSSDDPSYAQLREEMSEQFRLPRNCTSRGHLDGIQALLQGQTDIAIRSRSGHSGYPHDNAPWWLLIKNAGGVTVFIKETEIEDATRVPRFRRGPLTLTTEADFSQRDKKMPGFMAMRRRNIPAILLGS